MPLLSNFFLILCCNGALFDSFMDYFKVIRLFIPNIEMEFSCIY